MDIKRVILYAALVLVGYSLWADWQKEYPSIPQPSQSIEASSSEAMVPSPLDSKSSNVPVPAAIENSTSEVSQKVQTVHVKTDVLDLDIDLQHGNIINARLLDYPQQINEKNKPFVLLKNESNERYVANSGLFEMNGSSVEEVNAPLSSTHSAYQLQNGENELRVLLTGEDASGLRITKEFLFKKGSYLIGVSYQLDNRGSNKWIGYMNTQLLWTSPKEDKSSVFHMGSYTGASYSNPGHSRYQKVNFKDMTKSNLDLGVTGGWIAMQQHYFLTAWVPPATTDNRFYTRAAQNDFVIGAVSQTLSIKPNEKKSISSNLYLGPELTDVLKTISPGLDLTADYGWLWFVSFLLLSFIKTINSVVGNWGWSIVLVTVLIKLAFYRLSATSYKSMANMRKLQPKLVAIRERFGEDKAKISQATMELYRQEKVNPLGGCLPILIQIPVFIALYWVLIESVDFRQAPFILWINDLSAADVYHVLPVLMGLTMLIQQKLNPAPPDPIQAKVMMFLPVLFTAILWNSPSGLVLYWTVNNSLSILQQWYITKTLSDDTTSTKKLILAKSNK